MTREKDFDLGGAELDGPIPPITDDEKDAVRRFAAKHARDDDERDDFIEALLGED